MKRALLLLALLLYALPVRAGTPGEQGFTSVRTCVMQNDPAYCHTVLTPESYPIFDRFVSYRLMPCLPTDFTYDSEAVEDGRRVVKATMPAGGSRIYILRLVFADSRAGPKLDIPATFKRGLGDKWEEKVQMGEQVYLMMKQNMGDKLTCDMLNNLIKPKQKN